MPMARSRERSLQRAARGKSRRAWRRLVIRGNVRGNSQRSAWKRSEGRWSARTTKARAGTLPQRVRRDFSGIGYDEAMRRAREMVPILRERAQRAEDARMLIRDNEQLLHESGLFRFHQPKAF